MKAKSENLPMNPVQCLPIKEEDICDLLEPLLRIPSPAGFTDAIVHHVGEILTDMEVEFELTRRGAIRANLYGAESSPDRGVIGHLDTLGAQVKRLKENGRLEVVRIGHWSARWAEGARVTIHTDHGEARGTILPLKASGHTYNEEIDTQPVDWTNLEVRIDQPITDRQGLMAAGFNVGDIVSIDSNPDFSSNGYINARHLDDKAGVAAMLAALKSIRRHQAILPVDCHFLFTISEEIGSGASAVLHGDVAELVAVDNGTQAPGQNSSEFGVTIGMADSTGPFDWHLTHHLIGLAQACGVDHQREVFRYYRCDAASAIEAGNDIRTALLTFGVDASHGYERTHMDSLVQLARLLTAYVQSPPAVARDKRDLASIDGFPLQSEPGA